MKIEQKGAGVYYLSNNAKLDKKGIKWLEEKMRDENLNLARVCYENEESQLMAMVIMIRNRFTIQLIATFGRMNAIV